MKVRNAHRHPGQLGFTLVELLIGILLMGVFGIALYGFLSASMSSAATEKSRATTQMEARRAVDVIARELRQASSADGLNPGLAALSPTSITMYVDNVRAVNVDAPSNPRPWRVRYRVTDGNLVREHAEAIGTVRPFTYGAYTGQEVLVTDIANNNSVPLFRAFGSNGDVLSSSMTAPATASVAIVRLNVSVRYRLGESSQIAEYTTDVALRNPRS